jgi:protein-tyrosine phosphatase
VTMDAPTAGSYWVEPGRLLAGRYPSADDVATLRAAGVTLVVDFTETGELASYELPAPMRHERVPIADFTTADVGTVRRALDLLSRELAAGGVVYLHCRGGCGRTGSVVGCYLVERGLPPDEALARVAELCGARCPETPEQEALVRSWERPHEPRRAWL